MKVHTSCTFCPHPECCDICPVSNEPEKELSMEELTGSLTPGEVGTLMTLLTLYSEKAAVVADGHGVNNVVIEDKFMGVLNSYYEGAK